MGNLDHVTTKDVFKKANTGLAHTYQMINVEDFEVRFQFAYATIDNKENVSTIFPTILFRDEEKVPRQRITIKISGRLSMLWHCFNTWY